jgi:hypothetical protein
MQTICDMIHILSKSNELLQTKLVRPRYFQFQKFQTKPIRESIDVFSIAIGMNKKVKNISFFKNIQVILRLLL